MEIKAQWYIWYSSSLVPWCLKAMYFWSTACAIFLHLNCPSCPSPCRELLFIVQSPNQMPSPLWMRLWALGRAREYIFLKKILILFFHSPFIVIMTHTLHWHSLSARESGKQSFLCCVLRGKKSSVHIYSLAGPHILVHTFSYDARTQQLSYVR